MPRRVQREPQTEYDVLMDRITRLEDEVMKLRAANTTTIQSVDTETYHGGTQGEIVLQHTDESPTLPTARVRVHSAGEWYDIAGGAETPWVACWDTIYGTEYSTTSRRMYWSQQALSTNAGGIFSVNTYADPQVNTGYDDSFGNDFWHLPVLLTSGVFSFTLFFEVTDGSMPRFESQAVIQPTDIPPPSGSGAGDETFFPHEDISGFGFFRGIRMGSVPTDMTAYSNWDTITICQTVMLPILLDSSGGSGVPDPPAEFTGYHAFTRPSADTSEMSWCRSALYIMYHGPLAYIGHFPYFP